MAAKTATSLRPIMTRSSSSFHLFGISGKPRRFTLRMVLDGLRGVRFPYRALFWMIPIWLLLLFVFPLEHLQLEGCPTKSSSHQRGCDTWRLRSLWAPTTRVLNEYGFNKEMVAGLPVEYVQRMLKSYSLARRAGASKVLVIHVQHGMSNRLRAYLSAKAFATSTGRHLRVVWIPDEHCNARFSDLFDNPEDVFDHFEPAEISGPNFVTFDYMDTSQKYKLIEDGPENIYVRSAYLLNMTRGFEDVDVSAPFQALTPVAEIREELQRYHKKELCPSKPDWWPCMPYVGVHMRQGTPPIGGNSAEDLDQYPVEDKSTLYLARTQLSATVHFIHGLRPIVAEDPTLKIFVASDTFESIQRLKQEFGMRVFHVERPDSCGPNARNVICQRLALVDILMLGFSSYPVILGSFWSSFTEVASRLQNKRVIRASVDFEAPGLSPLTCNPSTWAAPKVFEGVSVCTALTPSRTDVLLQALPTWLAARGVLEVIVLDYMPGNDTRLNDAIARVKDPRVKYVKVTGNGPFVITRAYNLAVLNSRGSRIAKLDSDNKITPEFVEQHPHINDVFYAGNWKAARSENERHLNGAYLVNRDTWVKVNGFDERIVGYGHDDDNLHMRLSQVAERRNLKFDHIKHIEHASSRVTGATVTVFPDVSIIYNRELTERLPLWDDQNRGTQYKCNQLLNGTCDCHVAAPAETIKSNLSAEQERQFRVAAYREVVAYSAALPKDKLETVNSLTWFEKQLQMHYEKGRREWVVVRPMGTCADRSDAIAAGRHLSKKLGRPFRVVWQPDSECREKLSALFGVDLDVSEEFYDWEVNYKYADFDLLAGPDWLLPSTTFPKKTLFITARGAFGDPMFSPEKLQTFSRSLLPVPRSLGRRSVSPFLVADLAGGLPERLLLLARAVMLSYKLDRRLIIVWDPAEVGGVELLEIVDSPYLVLPPWKVPSGLPGPKLQLVKANGSLGSIPRGSHLRVSRDVLMDQEVNESRLNTVVGLIDISFALKEAAYKQMVGKGFRGLVLGDDYSCSDEGLFGAVQASLKAADITQGSYFAATASEGMCARLRTRGVRCTATCHPGSTGECHLAHLAMTLALAQSKALYFTSWADKSIDWILRRGLISGVMLECDAKQYDSARPLFRPALGSLGLVGEAESISGGGLCGKGKLHMITQYPLLKGGNRGARQAEYATTLATNLAHPQIAAVHILLEAAEDEAVIRAQFPDPCTKFRFSVLGRRLAYNDTFAYANQNLRGEICAVANGDISFEAGLDALSVERHLAGGARALALSRHEETESDVCGRNMCFRYEHTETGYLSSDAFIFLAPVPDVVINKTGFGPQPGSENVIIWALKRGGLDVRNPCRSVRVFHNHCSNDRSGLPTDVQTWETKVEQDARIDIKICEEEHCGDGWCANGPEVLEDLEEEV